MSSPRVLTEACPHCTTPTSKDLIFSGTSNIPYVARYGPDGTVVNANPNWRVLHFRCTECECVYEVIENADGTLKQEATLITSCY